MGNVIKMERKCSRCGKRPSECDGYPKGSRTFLCPWRAIKPSGPVDKTDAPGP